MIIIPFFANNWELDTVKKPEDHMTFDEKKIDASWKVDYLAQAVGEGIPDAPYKTAGVARTLANVFSGWDHNDGLVAFGDHDESGSQAMFCYFQFQKNNNAKYHFLIAKDSAPDSTITVVPFRRNLIGTVRAVEGIDLLVSTTFPISSDAIYPLAYPVEMCHSDTLKDHGNFPSQIFQLSAAAFMEGSSANQKRAELQAKHCEMPSEFLGMVIPSKSASASCNFWADLSGVVESGIAAVGNTFKFVTSDTVSTDDLVDTWSDLFLSSAKLGNSVIDLFPPPEDSKKILQEANKIVVEDEKKKLENRMTNQTSTFARNARNRQNQAANPTTAPSTTSKVNPRGQRRNRAKGKGKGPGRAGK